MPAEIRNISLVADNSVFPPEIAISNEVITQIIQANPTPKFIRFKCKMMKNICGYISVGDCCNSKCNSRCSNRKRPCKPMCRSNRTKTNSCCFNICCSCSMKCFKF